MSRTRIWGIVAVVIGGVAGVARPAEAQIVELPREVEIELALSALPAPLREGATVLVLEAGQGFVTAREGDNGFHTLVSRVEPAVFRADRPYTVHAPDVLLPISFDAGGVDGPMQPFLDAGELLAKGASPGEMQRVMKARFAQDSYRPASRPGVSYMLAPVMRAYPTPLADDRVFTINVPHRMFYAPNITDDDIGGRRTVVTQAYLIQPGVHGYIGQQSGPEEREAINAEHARLIDRLCTLHDAWCLPGTRTDVREVALRMPWSIDHAERDVFESLFTEDAIMYFPFRAERANGKDEIVAVMRPIFERNRQRGPGPHFGFEPEEVSVDLIGDEAASVTWIMRVGERLSRRTAVLRRTDGEWKIALVHADNWSG